MVWQTRDKSILEYKAMAETIYTTVPKGPYLSIADIKDANRRAGYHWFSAEAMRSFACKVYEPVFHGRFFISSEQDKYRAGNPREYSIRYCDNSGQIQTVGDFQQYSSKDKAERALRRFLSGAEEWPRDFRGDPPTFPANPETVKAEIGAAIEAARSAKSRIGHAVSFAENDGNGADLKAELVKAADKLAEAIAAL